ncbi:MAG: SIS domain-containing protein [Phycisphaerae bacterium]
MFPTLAGNGGSAATVSHMAVDLGRIARSATRAGSGVVSLTDNVPWLTAVSNDQSFDDCFAEQLRGPLRPGDLLIGISASGDSENLVRAFRLAQRRGAARLALVGFDGGRLARLATRRIWVDSQDYGIVESVHLFVAHLLRELMSEGNVRQPGRSVTSAAIAVGCEP